MSHTASFVTIVAALQTIPCCDALLPAPGGHDVHWEAGDSALLHHTDDASGPCSGGSDCLDRQSRPRLPWLFTCPAQRLAQLANALPPLFLRRGLRLRQSQQRPPSEDGSTPASTSFYMTRGGVLRTPKTSWPRPRHNWNPSGRDLFERIWVLPEGRDIPRLMQAFRERFGIRFGRCLDLLQADSSTHPRPGASGSTDVQGARSKAAAAPHARAHASGRRP